MVPLRFGIKTKIVLPIIIITFLLATVIFLFVSIHITRLAENFSHQRVLGAAQTARVHLKGLEEQSRIVSHSVSVNPHFINHLMLRDRDNLLMFLEYSIRLYGVDSFMVTDENGIVVLRTHNVGQYGDDSSFSPGISNAMAGNFSTVYIVHPAFPIGFASTSPVISPDGKIIGTVVAIYDLSLYSYVDEFSDLFNADVVFFANTDVVSASLRDESGERTSDIVPHADVLAAVLGRGEEVDKIQRIHGDEYHAFYYPLFGHGDEVVGMFFIGFSREDKLATVFTIRIGIIIFGLISLLIAFAIMFILLNKFIEPLERLTRDVWEISDSFGEYVNVYGISRSDEVGDLSRNIQHMRNMLVALSEETLMLSEEMQKASESKSRFLSNMSHEIRTPMNAITGMVTIGMASADAERKQYALEKIGNASAHLLGVINDVLDMSKIEANKFDLNPTHFNMKRSVENIIDVIRFRIDEKNQNLIINIDPDIPSSLVGDVQRLMQVITNLIFNAAKFTGENGKIELNISLVKNENDICTIQTDIADTGIGLSEEQRQRVFDSFEQAESSTARKYGGTGLGLAISKQIVNLMGGEIWVESTLGEGATFSFTVELACGEGDAIDGAEEAATDKENISFEGLHILIAEDIDINMEIVIFLLEGTGLIIDCATDGEEAVNAYASNPDKYSLIFMDIQMPKVNGYDAARQIRAIEGETGKRIPIIAMTANVFKKEIEQCLEAGMDDHVGKPIEQSILMEKLCKHLKPQ
jgi:signal transduction histidine kinase/CheY-like chemotaxis protein